MRKTFRGNRKDQREIIQDANFIRIDEEDMDIYMLDEGSTVQVQVFQGNKVKPTLHSRFRNLEYAETRIKELVNMFKSRREWKEKNKALKKERQNILKSKLIPGATVRTSFSYNMTFNKFYKVVSNTRNTYTLEILGTDWVSGDFGWTGNVKAGSPTGKFIEGKLTASGIKIDNLYGDVIDPNDDFYECHLD